MPLQAAVVGLSQRLCHTTCVLESWPAVGNGSKINPLLAKKRSMLTIF
jgi:hypothetical protein